MALRSTNGQQSLRTWPGSMAGLAFAVLTGCGQVDPGADPPAVAASNGSPVVVDVAVAQPTDGLGRTYAGTTQPVQQVSLRSQAEGQLLNLVVDVGDAVQQGQTLGTLDSSLLQTDLGEAQAELAARQFEVAQAEAEFADIRTLIEQARVRLQQADNDAQRLQSLASKGAISTQAAEQAQTTLRTAQQALQSAQEQLRTRQQAVSAAQQRVAAQAAMVQQAQKRLSYATLTAPLTATVLERLAEPGDLVQPGQAVLTLGDMGAIHVVVNVADSNRQDFLLGQTVNIQLDALPGERFTGQVTRISPVADSASRLIPVEITLANTNNRIGSGMLARVNQPSPDSGTVVVPQSALNGANGDNQQVFVLTGPGDQTVVETRIVELGPQTDGQVIILAGLEPGERYVVRSGEPLVPGQPVKPSLISPP
jgi:HlyD family secretion protein